MGCGGHPDEVVLPEEAVIENQRKRIEQLEIIVASLGPSGPRELPPAEAPNEERIMLSIVALMKAIHRTAVGRDWWKKPLTFGEQIANMHSELSEAWEEWRDHGLDPARLLTYDETQPNEKGEPKPVGIAAELADVVIRVLDSCEGFEIPLLDAMLAKIEYNQSRPKRHGGKKA